VIFIYSMLFTSLVSFFAVMINPTPRAALLDNLIGGLPCTSSAGLRALALSRLFVVAWGP